MIAVPVLVAAALTLSAAATSPNALGRLEWLAGCWRRASATRVVEETWMAPVAGLMLGSGRTTSAADGSLIEYEQTRIEANGDTIVFVARPSRQPEAMFIAIRFTDSLIVFENAAHDFPQRVGYRLVNADSMAGWIEGTVDGKSRHVDFPYARVVCPGAAR